MTIKTYVEDKTNELQNTLLEDCIFSIENKEYIALDILGESYVSPSELRENGIYTKRYIKDMMAVNLTDLNIPIVRSGINDGNPLLVDSKNGSVSLLIKEVNGVFVLCIKKDELIDTLNQHGVRNDIDMDDYLDERKECICYGKARVVRDEEYVDITPLCIYIPIILNRK